MNRIFKVIWSKSKQAYVVVSECARTRGGKTKLTAAVLAFLMGLSAGTSAVSAWSSSEESLMAEVMKRIDAKYVQNGSNIVILGNAAQSDNISLGRDSYARASAGIAIGRETQSGLNSITMGRMARAAYSRPGNAGWEGATVTYTLGGDPNNPVFNKNAVAIGTNSLAGASNIASTVPRDENTYLDYASIANLRGDVVYYRTQMTKIKDANQKGISDRYYRQGDIATAAKGDGKLNLYDVVRDSGTDQVAVGTHSRAIGDQAIAIGSNSMAGRYSIVMGGNSFGDKNDADSFYKMYLDNGGIFRTLSGYKWIDSSPKNDIEGSTYAGEASVAIGTKAHTMSPMGAAVGAMARIEQNSFGAVALGAGSSVGTQRSGHESIGAVAIGMGSVAKGIGTIALGSRAMVWPKNGDVHRITAIGYGTTANNADSIALGSLAEADRGSDMAGYFYGYKAATIDKSKEAGSIDLKLKDGAADLIENYEVKVTPSAWEVPTATETDIVKGFRTHVYEGLKGPALKANAGALSIGKKGSTPNAADAITRQIVNVAAGTNDTDAVNVAQLRNVNMMVEADAAAAGTPKPFSDFLLDNSRLKISGQSYLSTELSQDKEGPRITLKAKTTELVSNQDGTYTTKNNEDGLITGGELVKKMNEAKQARDKLEKKLSDLTYLNENGDPLVKGDDGKFYKPKADGTPDTKAGEQKPAGVRLGEKDKPMQLTNVAPAAKEITAEGPTKGLADLANAKDNTVATVADLKKLGFVVSAGDNYSEKVQHAQEVNFKGEGLAEVSGKTEGQKRVITVKVDDKKVADAVKTINDKAGNAPTQYVDKDGNPLVKAKDGKYYPKDKVGDDGTPKPNAQAVEPASIQVGEKGKPTQLTNVKPGTEAITTNGPTKGLADFTNAKPGTVATIDDLQRLGFVVADGASYHDTVTNAQTVKFVGDGLATVTGETKNNIRTFTVKVDKEEVAKAINAEGAKKGTAPTTYVDANGNPLVKGDDGKYYKPKADGTPDTTAGEQKPAGVRLGEKDKPIQLTNVAPATKAIDKPNDPTNGLADLTNAKDGTVATVADLKKLGFVVSAGDNYSEKVQHAQEVNFKGEGLAEVSGKTEGQKRIITVKVDDKKVADAVKSINDKAGNAPIQYVDKDGNPLVKAKDGKYYPKDKVGDDGTPKPNAQAVEPASIQVGEKGKPTQLTNVKPGTNDIKDEGPTKGLADLKNAVPGTVATVDDLKKLGFVIKGKASDGTTDVVAQVKHADTVEFAGEDLAKVVTESKDGVSKVTVKVNKEEIAKAVNAENAKKGSAPTTYVDKDGNPLVKGDDGKYYKPKADGTPDTTAGEQTPAGVRLGEKDKPIQLTNVAPATKEITTEGPTKGLADLAKAKDGTVATVADLKKLGFVVSAGDNYSEKVQNAQEVNFKGEGLAEVSGKTEGQKRIITVKVDDKKVADAVKTINDKAGNAPTQYVDKDGNPLVKAKDGNYYPKDKVGDDGQPKPDAKSVEPAGIQVGEKGKPTQLTNVKPGTNDIKDEGPTKGLADLKNAVPGTVATVDDLKKLGFVIKGKASDGTTDVVAQVKHADTVEFAGEDLAKVVTESKDGVSKVTVKVNKEEIAKAVNAENAKKGSTPTTYVDKDGNPLVKGDDGKYYKAKADGTPDTTAGEQTPAGVRLGEKDKPIQLTNVAPATKEITTEGPTKGLADLAKAKDGTVATVADLKKLGFVVADGANYHETVTNAQTVKFVGEGLAEVSGKTENDVRTFTVKVDDKKVADAVKSINDKAGNAPTQYVDKDGNPLVKVGDKYYPKDKIGDDGQPKPDAQAVEPAGIQVGEKGKPTQIMNVAPATKAIDKPNDPTNGLADLANAKEGTVATVDDLKKLGFVIKGKAADGTTDVTGQVKHANTVEFAGEDLAKVITESANGESKVTVKVNKEDIVKVVNDANDKKGSAPTQYVDKDGNPLVKGDDGKYYKQNPDGTPNKGEGEQTPAGIKVGEKDKPMQLDNVARGTETKPVNGKDGQPIMGSANQPLQLVDLKDAKDTKVATVGDLKDMGFVLGASVNAAGGNKAYQDVVKNGNKVKFVGLGGAWISGKTDNDGTRIITIDVDADNLLTGTQNAIQYVDGQGNRMIPMLQKGKEVLYYNAADNPVKHKTPTGEEAVYKASDIIDEAGTLSPNAQPLQGKKAGDVSGLGVALVDPNGSADTQKGTVLRNVGEGTATIAAPQNADDKVGKAKEGLADLDKSKDTNGLSVADAKKLGWVISTGKDGKDFAEKVKTADEVNFQGEENGPITVTGSADGYKRIVTIGVDAQKMAAVVKSELDKSGDSNVQYVDKDGKPLVKVGDKYYTKDQLQDNGQPKDDAKDSKPAAQKLAGTEPMQLKNVAPGTKSIEAPKEADAKPADKAKAGLADLSVPTNADKDKDKAAKNTAATVDDLRRMGWILSTGDDYAEKVQNANEINFKGVDGVTITGKTDGGKRIVSVGVDAQAVIEHADIPVVYKTQDNKPLTKIGNDFYEKPEKSDDAPVFVQGAVYKKSDLGNDGKPKDGAQPLTPVAKEKMKASLNGDKPMVLSKVGPGVEGTDAVNKEQMDSAVAAMAKAVGNAQDEVRGVGADAAALAGLKPLQYDPIEPTQIMAALGNYDNKTALALGVAHYTNESTMLNAGVSLGGKHRMVNVGYTKKFGHSSAERAIPDRYKAGPISSVYVMQDEVTMLKAENEQQKNELQNQKREIQELRDIVKALLAKK